MADAVIEDFAKEAAEDAAKTAGEAAVEASIKDAIENVEKSAKDLLSNSMDGLTRDRALALLGKSSGATEAEIADSMKSAINDTGPDVSRDVTNQSTNDIKGAKDEANQVVADAEKDGSKLSDAEKEAKAKDVFNKPKYNYGKWSGTIMKFSAFAAVAILMLKNFFSKLNKAYIVQQITLSGDYVTFTICDGGDFAPGDSFTFSKFALPYTILNGTTLKLTDSAGPTIIKVKKSDLVQNSVNSSSDATHNCAENPLGTITCSPDLAGNLLHSTGEVLDDVIKTADDALNKIGNDLGLGSFKWILIGAAAIFFIVLLYWVYKTFVKK
jgi:hypothetical protein